MPTISIRKRLRRSITRARVNNAMDDPARKRASASAEPSTRYAIAALLEDIAGVPVVADPVAVKRRSRDFFWYSPVLNQQLQRKFADVVVCPRDEADVIRVVAA